MTKGPSSPYQTSNNDKLAIQMVKVIYNRHATMTNYDMIGSSYLYQTSDHDKLQNDWFKLSNTDQPQ